MKHPLAKSYDDSEDDKLLKLLRFHALAENQHDLKICRILRQAANRIEELKTE